MSFGAFAGGLSFGLMNGARVGKTFAELAKERGLEDVRAKAMQEASDARTASVAGMVKDTGAGGNSGGGVETSVATATPVQKDAPIEAQPMPPIDATVTPSSNAPATQSTTAESPSTTPAAAPSATTQAAEVPVKAEPKATDAKPQGLPGRYKVGDKSFETKEEAMAHAEKTAPSLQDYQLKTMVPKMQAYYIGQGDIDKAEAWRKYAESRETQKNMDIWGKAWRAAATGNYEKAADHVFELYKAYDDGITPLSKEVVKDKSGNVTGFNVRLKNDQSGEEYVQFINPKQLTELGISSLSAPALFEAQYKRQMERDKITGELAKEDRRFSRDVKMEGVKHDNKLEELTIQEQLRTAGASNTVRKQIDAKISALKAAGYSDSFINESLPGIIGIGDYKKRTSPEEAKRLALSDRMKSDPTFSRKPPEEQRRIIEQDMDLVYGGVKPSSTTPANPAASGLPTPAAPAAKKGVPVYDTKTGSVIYR